MHKRQRFGYHVLTFGTIAVLAATLISPVATASPQPIDLATVSSLSNQQRISNGLSPLTKSEDLDLAASRKAQHMLNNDYFDHVAPDGTTAWDFIKNTGYGYVNAGENLAATNQDEASIVQGWMDSPGHRENLLKPNFSQVGYGSVYIDEWEHEGVVYYEVYFVVALYAEPNAEEISSTGSSFDSSDSQVAASSSTSESSGETELQLTSGEGQTAANNDQTEPATSQIDESGAESTEPTSNQEISSQLWSPRESPVKILVEPSSWYQISRALIMAGVLLMLLGSSYEIIHLHRHTHV